MREFVGGTADAQGRCVVRGLDGVLVKCDLLTRGHHAALGPDDQREPHTDYEATYQYEEPLILEQIHPSNDVWVIALPQRPTLHRFPINQSILGVL